MIGVLALVAGAGVLSIARRPAPPAALGGLQVLGQVPPFELTERSGRRVSLDDLRGSPWIADFVFTRCAGSCPLLSASMARLQEKLGVGREPGLRLVSFSVDPAYDTPEVLRAYAESHRASEQGWLFLTGERRALSDLIQNGFHLSVVENQGTSDPNEMITHSDRFVLVDGEGRIRGYYHGVEEEGVGRLLDDLAHLRKEGTRDARSSSGGAGDE